VLRRLFAPLLVASAALSALAIGTRPRKNAPPGNLKLAVLPVEFPTKYVVDEPLTPADFGLNRVEYGYAVLTSISNGAVNIANVIYDPEEETLILVDETPAQVAAEAEIKKPTALVFAYGS
jgi:hypothetical protein